MSLGKVARKLKRVGKVATQFRFTSTFEYIDLRCTGTWRPDALRVTWLRSHRKVQSLTVPWIPSEDRGPQGAEGRATFDPPFSVALVITLYQEGHNTYYDDKEYKFYIESVGPAGKKIVASFNCDMAEYAGIPSTRHALDMNFKSVSQKVTSVALGITLESQFIKKGSAVDDDMQSTFSHASAGRDSTTFDDEDEEDDSMEGLKREKQSPKLSILREEGSITESTDRIVTLGTGEKVSQSTLPHVPPPKPSRSHHKETSQELDLALDALATPDHFNTGPHALSNGGALNGISDGTSSTPEQNGISSIGPRQDQHGDDSGLTPSATARGTDSSDGNVMSMKTGVGDSESGEVEGSSKPADDLSSWVLVEANEPQQLVGGGEDGGGTLDDSAKQSVNGVGKEEEEEEEEESERTGSLANGVERGKTSKSSDNAEQSLQDKATEEPLEDGERIEFTEQTKSSVTATITAREDPIPPPKKWTLLTPSTPVHHNGEGGSEEIEISSKSETDTKVTVEEMGGPDIPMPHRWTSMEEATPIATERRVGELGTMPPPGTEGEGEKRVYDKESPKAKEEETESSVAHSQGEETSPSKLMCEVSRKIEEQEKRDERESRKTTAEASNSPSPKTRRTVTSMETEEDQPDGNEEERETENGEQDVPVVQEPPSIASAWLGDAALIDCFGEPVPHSKLDQADIIGLYFSANWCPPCRRFLPRLVKFYHHLKQHNKSFEILYISSDYSKQEMLKYMQDQQMPWVGLAFDSAHADKLRTDFHVSAIPLFTIITTRGKRLQESAKKIVEGASSSSQVIKLYNSWCEKIAALSQSQTSPKGGKAHITQSSASVQDARKQTSGQPDDSSRTVVKQHPRQYTRSKSVTRELLEEKEERIRYLEEVNMTLKHTNDELNEEVAELKKQLDETTHKLKVIEQSSRKLQTEKEELLANINLRGWLYKRGVKGPTANVWRRRYFRCDQGGKLYYYKSPTQTAPQGYIDLDKVITVQVVSGAQQDKNHATFLVQCDGRTFQLQAHDEPTMRKWISAIEYLSNWRKRHSSFSADGATP